jgi:hypothetical protein
MVDWVDTQRLEHEVDCGLSVRTPLDGTTADALGSAYTHYRVMVNEGRTNWQQLRKNRGFDVDTKDWDIAETDVLSEENLDAIDAMPDEPESVARFGFATPAEETEMYRQHVRDILANFKANGKNTFTPADIKAAGFEGRTGAWLSQNLRRMRNDGVVTYDKKTKFYTIV